MLLLGRARVHDLQAACGASMYVPVTPHGFNMNYMYIYILNYMYIYIHMYMNVDIG